MNPWQMCSLEFAKKLKSLGVAQDVSEFYWWVSASGRNCLEDRKADCSPLMTYSTDCQSGGRHNSAMQFCFAALTTAELGVALPQGYFSCRFDARNKSVFQMTKIWEKDFPACDSNTESNARAKLLCYVLENKIISVDEVNKRLREVV